MSRYVDVDVLKKQDFQDYSNSDVEYAIDHCPTADVVEVKHRSNENVCAVIFKAMNGFVPEEPENTESELKKCPFCGGRAIIHDCAELDNEKVAAVCSGKVGVHCERCGVATLPFENKDLAINSWNRRTSDE